MRDAGLPQQGQHRRITEMKNGQRGAEHQEFLRLQKDGETRHTVVVLWPRAACGPVIDVARIDKKSRDDREQRHDRENHKHGTETREIADAAGQRRRCDIAAVVESLVAPDW